MNASHTITFPSCIKWPEINNVIITVCKSLCYNKEQKRRSLTCEELTILLLSLHQSIHRTLFPCPFRVLLVFMTNCPRPSTFSATWCTAHKQKLAWRCDHDLKVKTLRSQRNVWVQCHKSPLELCVNINQITELAIKGVIYYHHLHNQQMKISKIKYIKKKKFALRHSSSLTGLGSHCKSDKASYGEKGHCPQFDKYEYGC